MPSRGRADGRPRIKSGVTNTIRSGMTEGEAGYDGGRAGKDVLWTRREPAWGFRILSRTIFGRNHGFSPLDRIQLCLLTSCRVQSSIIVSFLPNSRKPNLPKSLTISGLRFSILTPMHDIGPWCNKNRPTKRVWAVVLRLFGDSGAV